MIQSRLLTLLIAAILIVSSSAAAVMTATAAKPAIQISSVAVTPSDPNIGETVTVEPTISNLQGSNDTVEITDIYIRTSGSTDEHERIEDVGSIAPGGSISVPISTTFESSGQKHLTVHVVVRDESEVHHSYKYPVSIDVNEPTVKADLSTSTPPNQSDITEVTLTNFGNTNLTNIEITATADGEIVGRNFMFDVDPEANQSVTFDTANVSDEAVTFTATYTAAGRNHTTSLTITPEEQVLGEIRLTGIETTRTGTGITIEGDAANIGSTDAESVLVRIQNSDSVNPTSPSGEYFVGAVEASEFATFELTAEAQPEVSSIPVEIAYIVDGERVTTTQAVDTVSTNSSALEESDQEASGDGGQESTAGSGGPLSSLPLTMIGIVLALLLLIVVGIYRWRTQ